MGGEIFVPGVAPLIWRNEKVPEGRTVTVAYECHDFSRMKGWRGRSSGGHKIEGDSERPRLSRRRTEPSISGACSAERGRKHERYCASERRERPTKIRPRRKAGVARWNRRRAAPRIQQTTDEEEGGNEVRRKGIRGDAHESTNDFEGRVEFERRSKRRTEEEPRHAL